MEPMNTASLPPRSGRFLLVALAALVFAVLAAHVIRHAPYVGHFDEGKLVTAGKRVVDSKTLDPGFFNYPSLPIYLTAAAMKAASDGRELKGALGPRYEPAAPVLAAKLVFAALAAAGLLFTGMACLRASSSTTAAALAMLAMFGTPLWHRLSWSYLNVDIVGAFFVSVVLYLLVRGAETSRWLARAALLGMLCGLAVASKYPLGLLLLPVGLHLVLARGHIDPRDGIVLGLSCAVAFAIAVPYSLLSTEAFLEDIRYEMAHYSKGHSGHQGSAGLSQLVWYLRYLTSQLGSGVAALCCVGAAAIVYRRRWEWLPILLWVVVLVGYFSTKTVRFPRNIVSVLPALAILMAIGLITARNWFTGMLAAMRWGPKRWHEIAVLAVILLPLSWTQIVQHSRPSEEPRRAAVRWLLEHAPQGAHVVLAEDLGIPEGSLENRFVLATLGRADLAGLDATKSEPPTFFVLPRYAARKKRSKKHRKMEKDLLRLTTTLPGSVAQFEGAPIRLNDRRFQRRPRPAVYIYRMQHQ